MVNSPSHLMTEQCENKIGSNFTHFELQCEVGSVYRHLILAVFSKFRHKVYLRKRQEGFLCETVASSNFCMILQRFQDKNHSLAPKCHLNRTMGTIFSIFRSLAPIGNKIGYRKLEKCVSEAYHP
jgi:hypothetical protein